MNQKPHRSTTHQEQFFHFVANKGELIGNPKVIKPGKAITVFIRKDDEVIAGIGKVSVWFGSAAVCCEKDNFCRATGRTVARRKYFSGKQIYLGQDKPTYEDIVSVFV